MDARNKLQVIHQLLKNTQDQSLFGVVSDIYNLSHPPEPLNTTEMHNVSGDIIRQAKHEVLLEFYKFSMTSDGGKEIYAALEDLKIRAENERMKINVCILVNSRGMLAETIYEQNTPIELERLTSSEYFNIKLTLHPTAAFGLLDTKMIIIDAKVAMIRGGDPDATNDLSREQVETATLLRGPIVHNMRDDYNSVWFSYCKESLPDISWKDEIICTDIQTEALPQIPCVFISKRENGNPFSLYYSYAKSPYKIALLQAISNATTSINIMTSNLNDYEICDALAMACIRDVQVNIITGKYHNDSIESWWGGTNFNSLAHLVSQVPIKNQCNITIRWASNPNGDIVYHKDKYAIQAKYVCVDNELVFTGSSPLDKQALVYSREADIIFLHQPTAILFDSKFFFEKFDQGKDYFEEAYFRIRNQIEIHTKRIGETADSAIKTDKFNRLCKALMHVGAKTISLREKLYDLIELCLPILQIPTGNKPGMPASYNAVIKYVARYGLDKHFNLQMIALQEKKEALSNPFPFFLSAASRRKRSLSESVSIHSDHDHNDDEMSYRNELRKSR